MPDGDNTHPMSGGSGKLLETLKKNPFGFFLAAMLLLAFIVSPRKRKYKPKRKYTKRRRKSRKGGSVAKVTGKPRKKKKGNKKQVSSAPATRTPKRKKAPRTMPERFFGRSSGLPPYRIKGSQAAKNYMKKLRLKRKK